MDGRPGFRSFSLYSTRCDEFVFIFSLYLSLIIVSSLLVWTVHPPTLSSLPDLVERASSFQFEFALLIPSVSLGCLPHLHPTLWIVAVLVAAALDLQDRRF
jgi:hypothetical protein